LFFILADSRLKFEWQPTLLSMLRGSGMANPLRHWLRRVTDGKSDIFFYKKNPLARVAKRWEEVRILPGRSAVPFLESGPKSRAIPCQDSAPNHGHLPVWRKPRSHVSAGLNRGKSPVICMSFCIPASRRFKLYRYLPWSGTSAHERQAALKLSWRVGDQVVTDL